VRVLHKPGLKIMMNVKQQQELVMKEIATDIIEW
jgi:hypothetical protein